MPGLRYYTTVDMGEAFGADWVRAFAPKRRRTSTAESALSKQATSEAAAGQPYQGWQAVASRSTVNLGASDLDDPFRDPDDGEEDDGGASDGTEYMTKAERRAYRIVQAMRRDPAWHGTRYRLLEKNCNSFTHELVWRLTGRKAPAWLNRAAWVATSIPCIVPAGWIDDADEAAPTAESAHIPDPAHVAGDDDTLTIKPPRADRMELGGRS
ncbi:hypothetical protein Rhopal_005143-T1 [Rhodotorula paludigena]|uniref:PPPDE domain-containing protein n=1 Tax=Rhodotorula paludigena TaxID=86838 RepID=A0AAV5GPN1_9BASI|nr:hypothetical protein Rhopal_005143-T1 [Rhodotorula paludigena]